MADARPSPPKKRRTDSGAISAEAIAQANSTLQLFTGQRQNRWMQGYVAPSAADGESGAPAKNRAAAVDNAAHKESAASTTSEVTPARDSNTGAATRRPDVEARELDITEYESPSCINAASAHQESTLARPADTMARVAAHPGLPSPAASDEHTTSPIIGVPQPSKQPGSANQPSLQSRRARPPSTEHARPSEASTGSDPLHVHQWRHAQQQQLQPRASLVSTSNANRPAHLHSSAPAGMLNRPGVAHRAPSQPSASVPQPPHQAQDTYLSKIAMLQRYQEFQAKIAARHKLNGVDSGRLTLLKHAIDKGDLFYIVLSQIHALTKTPDFIPESAQGVDKKSFQYLDYLLCSPHLISAPVLDWLQAFPGPITKIYFSTQSAAVYEAHVRQVVEFLRLLPQHWDRITAESVSRESPPLTEDLFDILRLPSPVFHVTAFRAIARLIMDPSKFTLPEKGIDRLEILYEMDQMWFSQNGRRTPEEKVLAYRAFRITKEAWKVYEERLKERDGSHLNRQKHSLSLDFNYPIDAIGAFQRRGPNLAQAGDAIRYQAMQRQAQSQLQRRQSNVAGQAIPPQQNAHTYLPPANGQPRNGTITPQQSLPSSGFVFPREGELPRAQPTNPDPNRSALHQAHLRSPVLTSNPTGSPLYRHVMGFALSPKKLNKDIPIQTFPFNVPQDNFDKIPATVPSQRLGEQPSRSLNESSHIYRLRCAAYPPNGFPSESMWVEAENYWPDNLYLEINDTILEPRRKLQHNRYLPIDLTHHIKLGENEIKAIINRRIHDSQPFDYVLAVEIIGVTSHESIKRQVPKISAAETQTAIKKSLSSGSNDEDIAVTSSNLTIKLFDPYSHSKIFDIPVRGVTCPHKDCFDLETFLSMCKREKPDWPTVVDCWRCPLCRGDVRPQTLVVDGFLVDVRRQLEERNLLSTRAIVIEADGSWKPKEEERSGVRSPSLEHEERSRSERSVSATASKKKQPEIIEID